MNTDKQHFFANEITLHFNLRNPKADRPTPIYAVVRIKSAQIKIPTKVRIYPHHWLKKKEQALVSSAFGYSENKNNRIVNQKIMSMRLGFSEFLGYIINKENCEMNKKNMLNILYNKLNINRIIRKKPNALLVLRGIIKDHSMKESSKRQYYCALKSFEDFIKEKKGKSVLAWDEFSLALITDYRDWFSKQVRAHGITKGCVRMTDNTVANKIKYINTLLNWAQEKELLDLRKTKIDKLKKQKVKMAKSEDNQIYLYEDEIARLQDLKLEGIEQQVRDLFIFQYEVGQRYCDINGLKPLTDGKEIHIIQEKTTKSIDIKLTDTAYRILQKYNFALPSIDNGKVNKLLKNIARKAKINRPIERCEKRGGEHYRYRVEAWQIISTHTARRSFISNCLGKGIDSELIKKQTGHSTNSAFTRYNRLGSIDASTKIAQVRNNSQNQIA